MVEHDDPTRSLFPQPHSATEAEQSLANNTNEHSTTATLQAAASVLP